MREHRAIWFSPMLGSWPGGNITANNVDYSKSSLDKRLVRLRSHGINTIYYHVRAHCDAAYASSYEPYSSSVAGSRGGQPAMDPFEYLVESAHRHGIEVYAWVNPLRYSSGKLYGAGERNYENSHPDWLMRSSEQIILNPALPEVRQRVADVCAEIAANYDIDGMIFDDYFYHTSIGLDADAELYNAYVAGGGTMSQQDWRRENINLTVKGVRDAVLATRPYTVFAIGPAGRISPDNIASYGLEPGPYGDMNYNGLYADPIYWLSQGWLDFLSPQVYWHSYFDKLTEWYSVVLPHFNRHLYTSVDCSRLGNNSAEYIRQIEFMRSHVRPNESGVVFFDYNAYNNYRETVDGSRYTFGEILRMQAFPYDALSPIHHWRGTLHDYETGAVVRNGNTLTWTAPQGAGQEAHRYAVYAVPAGEDRAAFACQPEYFVTTVYDESYTIPEEAPEATYAVAVYDRYSYLHTARFEGVATLDAGVAPTALTPTAGAGADLCDLGWTHAGAARYLVELSDDASFTTVIGMAETTQDFIPANNVATLDEGKTYYWRVTAYAADHSRATSTTASFTASRIAMTAPADGSNDCSLTPTLKWTGADNGCIFTVEIAEDKDFDQMVFSAQTTETSLTVPEKKLVSGNSYYARVTAGRNGATSMSGTVAFATADRTDYTAPQLINPASEGMTLHADEFIQVEPWSGMSSVNVEISGSDKFPVRGTGKILLKDFETTSKPLADIRIVGKPLEAGKTYWLRVRGGYFLQSSPGVVYTDYGPVRSFIYSDQSGVFAPETAPQAYIDRASVLHLSTPSPLRVFDLAGRCVYSAAPASEFDLSALGNGVYVLRMNNITLKWVK